MVVLTCPMWLSWSQLPSWGRRRTSTSPTPPPVWTGGKPERLGRHLARRRCVLANSDIWTSRGMTAGLALRLRCQSEHGYLRQSRQTEMQQLGGPPPFLPFCRLKSNWLAYNLKILWEEKRFTVMVLHQLSDYGGQDPDERLTDSAL